MGSLESYSGVWGILVYPSPPSWAYLQPTSFIGMISPVYTWGRRDLGSVQGSKSESWRLKVVSIWKFSRTYSDEKPPSFSVPKQGWCFATIKPTWHLLVVPYILVRVRAPYEGFMSHSVPPAQVLWTHL